MCDSCGETFYVAIIACNHEQFRKRHGVCPAPGVWAEHIGSVPFYFDVHHYFAAIMRIIYSLPPREYQPMDALDPTAVPVYGGTYVVDRARAEFSNAAALMYRRRNEWALSGKLVLLIYQYGDNFLGRQEGRQNPEAAYLSALHADAVANLAWHPVLPFLKPLHEMSEEFRGEVAAQPAR
jgi:hypothetical protein